MDSQNSNLVNNTSSAKAYILVVVFLALVLLSSVDLVTNYRTNGGCEEYLSFAQQYGITPDTCFQYSLSKVIIPSIAIALPFVFLLGVLLLKEKKKEYQFIEPKQEKIAFWLSIFTVIFFLFSFVLIKSIHCEGFGCLGLVPLIATIIGIFPPLLFGFSLWFLKSRYQWGKWKFLAVTICLVILVLIAYFQTPLL